MFSFYLVPAFGVWAGREKGNKAQAMKLLKAVEGRLGNGSGGGIGGALAELGGGNDLVCVASKVGVKAERHIIAPEEQVLLREGMGRGCCNSVTVVLLLTYYSDCFCLAVPVS